MEGTHRASVTREYRITRPGYGAADTRGTEGDRKRGKIRAANRHPDRPTHCQYQNCNTRLSQYNVYTDYCSAHEHHHNLADIIQRLPPSLQSIGRHVHNQYLEGRDRLDLRAIGMDLNLTRRQTESKLRQLRARGIALNTMIEKEGKPK